MKRDGAHYARVWLFSISMASALVLLGPGVPLWAKIVFDLSLVICFDRWLTERKARGQRSDR